MLSGHVNVGIHKYMCIIISNYYFTHFVCRFSYGILFLDKWWDIPWFRRKKDVRFNYEIINMANGRCIVHDTFSGNHWKIISRQR